MTTPASGLTPFTAEWLPTPGDVRRTLGPNRVAVADEHNDSEIALLIAQKAGAAAAEIPAHLPSNLQQCAHDYVMYAVAALCEAQWFPEQGNSPDSLRDWFSSQAGIEMARLRTALGEDTGNGEAEGAIGTIALVPAGTRRAAYMNRYSRFRPWGRYGGW